MAFLPAKRAVMVKLAVAARPFPPLQNASAMKRVDGIAPLLITALIPIVNSAQTILHTSAMPVMFQTEKCVATTPSTSAVLNTLTQLTALATTVFGTVFLRLLDLLESRTHSAQIQPVENALKTYPRLEQNALFLQVNYVVMEKRVVAVKLLNQTFASAPMDSGTVLPQRPVLFHLVVLKRFPAQMMPVELPMKNSVNMGKSSAVGRHSSQQQLLIAILQVVGLLMSLTLNAILTAGSALKKFQARRSISVLCLAKSVGIMKSLAAV